MIRRVIVQCLKRKGSKMEMILPPELQAIKDGMASYVELRNRAIRVIFTGDDSLKDEKISAILGAINMQWDAVTKVWMKLHHIRQVCFSEKCPVDEVDSAIAVALGKMAELEKQFAAELLVVEAALANWSQSK